MILDWRQINRNFAKVLFFILNGLCTLLAVGTIVFVLVDNYVLKQYGGGMGNVTFVSDVVIISACLYFVGVAAFGTVGVIKGNAKISHMYVTFLMSLVVAQVFITIYVAVLRYSLQLKVPEWLRDDFYGNITRFNKEQHEKFWEQMQITYKCCGLNGPEDYQLSMKPISMSCCPIANCATNEYAQHQLYKACIESLAYNTQGCKDELLWVLRTGSEWLLAVTVTSFAFEGAGMLLALYLTKNARTTSAMYKLKIPLTL